MKFKFKIYILYFKNNNMESQSESISDMKSHMSIKDIYKSFEV